MIKKIHLTTIPVIFLTTIYFSATIMFNKKNLLKHLLSKDALNRSKVTIKDMYNCCKRFLFQINAVLLNFLLIYESWKIKCITVYTKYCAARLFSTSIIIRNVSWAANYNDFWRSCDTEDWNNDAENTAAHHRNQLHATKYSHRKHFY